MAHHIEDRWLWVGLGMPSLPHTICASNPPPGIFSVLAIRGVSHGLRQIRTLTEVHTPPPLPSPRLTEDAIKTSSLSTLATCTNVEIRKAATKILLDRFIAHPSAYRHLIRDANSKDDARRHAAYLAFNLLEEYGYVGHQYGVPPPVPRTPVSRRGAARSEWLRAIPRRDGGGRDPEERDLRRRRREAVVINEGDRPFSQEDVFMRDGDGGMVSNGVGLELADREE